MNLRITILLFIAVLAGMAIAGARSRAQDGHHGAGHAEMHHVYQDWLQPGSKVSCCDNRDCRPTRARVGDNGLWEAWDGRQWLTVPAARVLSMPSPDGRSHLCEVGGTVLCFVPGEIRG